MFFVDLSVNTVFIKKNHTNKSLNTFNYSKIKFKSKKYISKIKEILHFLHPHSIYNIYENLNA